MKVNIICNIGDTIFIYDPEDGWESEKVIDNIIITSNDIILKADAHDNTICTYDKLVNTSPDEGGFYYFRCKKSRELFKESMKEKKE